MNTKIKTFSDWRSQLKMHPLLVLCVISSIGIWTINDNYKQKESSLNISTFSNADSPSNCKSYVHGTITDANANKVVGQVVYLKTSKKYRIVDSAVSDKNGEYIFCLKFSGKYVLVIDHSNSEYYEQPIDIQKGEQIINVALSRKIMTSAIVRLSKRSKRRSNFAVSPPFMYKSGDRESTEEYKSVKESRFIKTLQDPLSTFSSDVDNASYTNVRRMISQNQVPPIDAVRVEEFINYFDYTYSQPDYDQNISVQMEEATCPWKAEHKLVKIGLKAVDIEKTQMMPNNLVFLIDVSGSMGVPNKLPLVQSSLKIMIRNLNPSDKISIVTYAGYTKLALESTPCLDSSLIFKVIDGLNSGGSTAGGSGIVMAYDEANKNYIQDGNNRIILVTDGDFNVGVQNESELLKLIEEKRKSGVYLTVCGFGMGNYKDSKLEVLADNGNGNYYYIDNQREAERVFSYGLSSTLLTMAKDVKIQVEFNPKYVQAYRLIGYENRHLENEDFTDDEKDAGEMGAGQTVTALYEIVPWSVKMSDSNEVKLKYTRVDRAIADSSSEILTVKVRYKKPNTNRSIEIVKVLNTSHQTYNQASPDFRLACGVALFGMLLRESEYAGNADYKMVLKLLSGINNEKVNELIALVKWIEKNKTK